MHKTREMFSNRILKVIQENYRVHTLEIKHDMKEAMPGQFLMVWVPGVGEKPMSIGNNNPLTISVADVGQVSGEISRLSKGDLISYRGPLGKPFTLPKHTTQNRKLETGNPKRILVIGGGYGVVPMYFLAKTARKQGIEPVAVIGGRSADDIIYYKQLFVACKEVFITTDDGSKGKEGTVMAEAQWLIESKRFDCVYCCGPERMMHAVAELCKAHRVQCQVSVERYMKCGVGVCGSCDINGKLCCSDGPVFDGEEALALSEFGKKRRDASGTLRDI